MLSSINPNNPAPKKAPGRSPYTANPRLNCDRRCECMRIVGSLNQVGSPGRSTQSGRPFVCSVWRCIQRAGEASELSTAANPCSAYAIAPSERRNFLLHAKRPLSVGLYCKDWWRSGRSSNCTCWVRSQHLLHSTESCDAILPNSGANVCFPLLPVSCKSCG